MSILPRLRPGVVAAKERLAAGRERLRQRHADGTPGIQVCNALTDLVDSILVELAETILSELPEQDAAELRGNYALVPNGGFGRRDLAPYSDIDLMVLYAPRAHRVVVPFAERFLRDVFDAGMSLGHSVRTPAQAQSLALSDATICTSLVESRFLTGNEELFERFLTRFQARVQRHPGRLLRAIEQARAEERQQYGDTIYLLEPNVKRSPGGLRDIHLLRWIGAVRHGTPDPDGLQLRGALGPADRGALGRGSEFLLRLRNELHFHAGKGHDVLSRAEQLRIAAKFGYEGAGGLLPVEQFMQDYFRATTDVSQIVNHFVASAQPGHRLRAFFLPLLSHQVERDFRVGPTQITPTKQGREKLKRGVAQALRLADLANLYDKRISQEASAVIRQAAPTYTQALSDEAAEHFLSLLERPNRLGELLRTLHELRVLERVIPEFAHARCLLQFNEYHRYTVDEHSLRAVERATELRDASGPFGEVYREIKQKRVLHLALLIHDLGKGYVEDHSELGLQIAADTALRLRLPLAETELLKFLVHKHLVMSHLAFRRDTSDEQLVVRFAVDVGSPEALQMLFVLTASDLSAVGPGVLNRWKSEVLTDLYHRAMRYLGGDSGASASNRLQDKLAAARAVLREEADAEWFDKAVESLPAEYVRTTAVDRIAEELRELRRLPPGEVIARARYQPESHTVEYTICTHESIASGVFHRLTGALTSQGLQILSAQINTLSQGMVLDRFWANDPDYVDEPPTSRLEDVCARLVDSLRAADGATPEFRKTWSSRGNAPGTVLPTRVRTDNSTSAHYTIIDVFAADQTGLLYRITRTLYELGLSVWVAKIATHLDQVLDVFYVTDQAGQKILDESRLRQIQDRVLAEIEAHARQAADGVGAR